MKTIQWFPGHMTKALRMMEKEVPLADGIIYVLDARCPAASFNPVLKKLAGNKPRFVYFKQMRPRRRKGRRNA